MRPPCPFLWTSGPRGAVTACGSALRSRRSRPKKEDGRLAVGKLNIDDAPELAARYGISSIPTLILFKNGQACPPVVGPSGKGGIRAYLSEQGL